MLDNKEKTKEIVQALRELIRAECSAGMTLIVGDVEGHQIFYNYADEKADKFLALLAGE